jgi:hypothetical protein
MMKQITYLFTLLILAGCGQSRSVQKTAVGADSISLPQYKKVTVYALSDSITADFNGDGSLDKAFYIRENGTSGILIQHGKTNEEIRIGFGNQFAHFTEFDWVEHWGLVEDKKTNETTFTEDGDVLGSRVVKLENPSIFLDQQGLGGGLITFRNGKYVWIHQTC